MPDSAMTSSGPSPTERAQGAAQYAGLVARFAATGEKIVDYGIAHQHLGHAPPARHVAVAAPTEGFEHWKADMSARVPGGMTLGELQRRLGLVNQWLPIDADDDLTVAEVIAHNVYGPLRLTHGTCRDLLLGLRYVDATGTLITVGGRTVKNVAGYDVTRMMVGSLNMLGLIADANLRTSAIPEHVTRLELTGMDMAALDGLMTSLLTSDAAPWYIVGQVRGGEPVLHIGYSGTADGCAAQAQALFKWVAGNGLGSGTSPQRDGDLLTDHQWRSGSRAWRRRVTAHAKLIVPPADSGKVVKNLRAVEPAVEFIDSLPAHGIIHIGGNWDVKGACEMDQRVNDMIRPIAGIRVWYRRPMDTDRIAPFAPPQSDWPMLVRIKRTMDPNDMFNPGRFP